MTNRPQALAVLVAVFLLGGVIGAGGSYYWLKRTSISGNRVADIRPPMPERPNWRKLLSLTPDQEKSIREIMSQRWNQWEELRKEQAPKIEALQKEQAPKIEAFWEETNRQISSVLNEEQRKIFETQVKEMQKRIRPPRGRGFEPPPPGGVHNHSPLDGDSMHDRHESPGGADNPGEFAPRGPTPAPHP